MPQIKCERAWWRPASIISSAAVAIVLTTAPTVALAEEAGNQQADSAQVKQEQVVESVVTDATVPVAPVAVEAETVVENDVPAVEDDAPQSDAVETPETDTTVTDSEAVPADPSLDSTEVADDTTDDALESEDDAEDPSADVADDELVDDAEDVEGDAADDAATSEEDADLVEGETTADSTDEALVSEDGLGGATTSEEEDKEEETESAQTVADGTYALGSALDPTKVVDVPKGHFVNENNIQIYQGNGTISQMWEVTWHEDKDEQGGGYYTIGVKDTNKVLDVKWGNAYNGATVWLYENNGTLSQRWHIKKEGEFYSILSLLGNSNFYLDVRNGSTANGTKVWLYSGNGTDSQRFSFMEYYPEMPGEIYELVDGDGVYIIESVGGKSNGMVVDLSGGSFKDGANIQLYKNNGTAGQRFYFASDKDGYYTITNLASGKVLGLHGEGIVPSTNVEQTTYSAKSDAQKWALVKNGKNGSFSIINKLTGLALDVKWGSFKNSSNIWGYTPNDTVSQNWTLKKSSFVDDKDIYAIYAASNTGKVLDIKNGSSKDNAAVQVYTSNGTLSQRFEIQLVGEDTFRIRTATSGGWLTVVDGKVVQSNSADTTGTANTWKAVWNNGFFALQTSEMGSSSKQYVLTLMSNGTIGVKQLSSSSSDMQHFLFRTAQLISDGYYEISSALGKDLVLDVEGGTFSNGANVQIDKSKETNGQKFHIVWNGSGYVITAGRSDYALDAKHGGTTNGTNVWLYKTNGTKSQVWTAVIADGGGVVFKSSLSGLALDVKGGAATGGTNVQLYKPNGTASQAWRLSETKVLGGWIKDGSTWKYYDNNGDMLTDSIVAYNLYQQIKNESSRTDYLIAVDAEKCHVVLFKGSAGNWELVFDALAGTGDPYLASTDTDGYGVTGEGGNPWGSLRGYFWLGGDPASGYTDSNGRKEYDGSQQLKWFRSIYGEYGFHSTCGNYSDPSQVGKRLSHGCIRLLEKYAKMIYDLPSYTRVIVLPRYNGDFQIIR